MVSLSSVLENEQLEVQKALNAANLATLRNDKTKNHRITTFGQLMEKYNVSYDNKNYYKPNFELDYKLELIDFKNPFYVRDYITFEVNKKYFEYCAKNNIKIDGFITVPEHFINHIDEKIQSGFTKKRIRDFASCYIYDYIDENGKVYNNCYEKYIKDSLSEVRSKQQEGYFGDLLLNAINNNLKNNKKKFKIRRVSFQSIHVDYNRKLKYTKFRNPDKVKKVIDNVWCLDGLNAHKCTENKQIKVFLQVMIAQKVLRLLPEKYLHKQEIIIDDEICLETGNDEYYVAFHDGQKGTFLYSLINYASIVHELAHGIECDDWRYLNGNIPNIVYNFMYELTKGNEILDSNGLAEYKYKSIDSSNPNKYERYLTKLNEGNELVVESSEMLPTIFSSYLLKNIEFKDKQFFNSKINKAEKLEVLMAENFDKLCKLDIRLGALTLALFKGEL